MDSSPSIEGEADGRLFPVGDGVDAGDVEGGFAAAVVGEEELGAVDLRPVDLPGDGKVAAGERLVLEGAAEGDRVEVFLPDGCLGVVGGDVAGGEAELDRLQAGAEADQPVDVDVGVGEVGLLQFWGGGERGGAVAFAADPERAVAVDDKGFPGVGEFAVDAGPAVPGGERRQRLLFEFDLGFFAAGFFGFFFFEFFFRLLLGLIDERVGGRRDGGRGWLRRGGLVDGGGADALAVGRNRVGVVDEGDRRGRRGRSERCRRHRRGRRGDRCLARPGAESVPGPP